MQIIFEYYGKRHFLNYEEKHILGPKIKAILKIFYATATISK